MVHSRRKLFLVMLFFGCYLYSLASLVNDKQDSQRTCSCDGKSFCACAVFHSPSVDMLSMPLFTKTEFTTSEYNSEKVVVNVFCNGLDDGCDIASVSSPPMSIDASREFAVKPLTVIDDNDTAWVEMMTIFQQGYLQFCNAELELKLAVLIVMLLGLLFVFSLLQCLIYTIVTRDINRNSTSNGKNKLTPSPRKPSRVNQGAILPGQHCDNSAIRSRNHRESSPSTMTRTPIDDEYDGMIDTPTDRRRADPSPTEALSQANPHQMDDSPIDARANLTRSPLRGGRSTVVGFATPTTAVLTPTRSSTSHATMASGHAEMTTIVQIPPTDLDLSVDDEEEDDAMVHPSDVSMSTHDTCNSSNSSMERDNNNHRHRDTVHAIIVDGEVKSLIAKLETTVKELEVKLFERDVALATVQRTNTELNSELHQSKNLLADKEAEYSQLDAMYSLLYEDKAHLDLLLSAAMEKLEPYVDAPSASDMVTTLEKEITKLQEKLAPLEARNRDLVDQVNVAARENASTEIRLTGMRTMAESVADERQDMENKVIIGNQQREELMSNLNRVQLELADMIADRNRLLEKCLGLEAEQDQQLTQAPSMHEVQTTVAQLESEIRQHVQQNLSMTQALSRLNEDAEYHRMETINRSDGWNQERISLVEELQKIRTASESWDEERRQMAAKFDTVRFQLSLKEAVIKDQEDEIGALTKMLCQEKQRVDIIMQTNQDEMNHEIVSHSQELDTLRQELLDCASDYNQKLEAMRVSISEEEHCKTAATLLESEIIRQQLVDAYAEIDSLKQELRQAANSIVSDSNNSQDAEIKELNMQIGTMRDDLHRLQQALDDTRSSYEKQLQSLAANMKNSISQREVIMLVEKTPETMGISTQREDELAAVNREDESRENLVGVCQDELVSIRDKYERQLQAVNQNVLDMQSTIKNREDELHNLHNQLDASRSTMEELRVTNEQLTQQLGTEALLHATSIAKLESDLGEAKARSQRLEAQLLTAAAKLVATKQQQQQQQQHPLPPQDLTGPVEQAVDRANTLPEEEAKDNLANVDEEAGLNAAEPDGEATRKKKRNNKKKKRNPSLVVVADVMEPSLESGTQAAADEELRLQVQLLELQPQIDSNVQHNDFINKLASDNARLTDEISRLTSQLQELGAAVTSQQSSWVTERREMERQIEVYKESIADETEQTSRALSHAMTEALELQQQLNALADAMDTAASTNVDLTALQADLEKAIATNSEYKMQLEMLETEKQELLQMLTSANEELSSKDREYQQLQDVLVSEQRALVCKLEQIDAASPPNSPCDDAKSEDELVVASLALDTGIDNNNAVLTQLHQLFSDLSSKLTHSTSVELLLARDNDAFQQKLETLQLNVEQLEKHHDGALTGWQAEKQELLVKLDIAEQQMAANSRRYNQNTAVEDDDVDVKARVISSVSRDNSEIQGLEQMLACEKKSNIDLQSKLRLVSAELSKLRSWYAIQFPPTSNGMLHTNISMTSISAAHGLSTLLADSSKSSSNDGNHEFDGLPSETNADDSVLSIAPLMLREPGHKESGIPETGVSAPPTPTTSTSNVDSSPGVTALFSMGTSRGSPPPFPFISPSMSLSRGTESSMDSGFGPESQQLAGVVPQSRGRDESNPTWVGDNDENNSISMVNNIGDQGSVSGAGSHGLSPRDGDSHSQFVDSIYSNSRDSPDSGFGSGMLLEFQGHSKQSTGTPPHPSIQNRNRPIDNEIDEVFEMDGLEVRIISPRRPSSGLLSATSTPSRSRRQTPSRNAPESTGRHSHSLNLSPGNQNLNNVQFRAPLQPPLYQDLFYERLQRQQQLQQMRQRIHPQSSQLQHQHPRSRETSPMHSGGAFGINSSAAPSILADGGASAIPDTNSNSHVAAMGLSQPIMQLSMSIADMLGEMPDRIDSADTVVDDDISFRTDDVGLVDISLDVNVHTAPAIMRHRLSQSLFDMDDSHDGSNAFGFARAGINDELLAEAEVDAGSVSRNGSPVDGVMVALDHSMLRDLDVITPIESITVGTNSMLPNMENSTSFAPSSVQTGRSSASIPTPAPVWGSPIPISPISSFASSHAAVRKSTLAVELDSASVGKSPHQAAKPGALHSVQRGGMKDGRDKNAIATGIVTPSRLLRKTNGQLHTTDRYVEAYLSNAIPTPSRHPGRSQSKSQPGTPVGTPSRCQVSASASGLGTSVSPTRPGPGAARTEGGETLGKRSKSATSLNDSQIQLFNKYTSRK